MSDIEAVTARWIRRNADQRFRFALFTEFSAGEIMPGTMLYERMELAIAWQRLVHALRPIVRHLLRWAPDTAMGR